MNAGRHTATPWDYVSARTLIHVETRHDNETGAGMPVCSLPKSCEGDTAFIVTACNAHKALVEALKEVREFWLGGNCPEELMARIDAALALAQGLAENRGYILTGDVSARGRLRRIP